jgi:hypothetical protein
MPGPFTLLSNTGQVLTSSEGSGLLGGPAPVNPPRPLVMLRWSDDRGRTWSQPIGQSLGATGQYLAQPKWNRLGRGRDRVFEIYGTIPGRMAIQGAWLSPAPIKMGN